jgi:ATP-dependent Zn protease
MSLAPYQPVEGLRAPGEGPDNAVRPTRPKLKFWDRIKFVLLLTIAWFMLVWAKMASIPILPFEDAMRLKTEDGSGRFILTLLGIELLRQVHFFISERSAGYHRLWTHKVFGGSERIAHRRLSDWTRFRLARVIKWAVFFAVVIAIISAFMDLSPILAVFQLPALIWQALPIVFQFAFGFFFIMVQFIGLFWFLSRGGIDTYYPEDIKTRFTDVWGQDHVVARVKENIVFLEKPLEIESKGGYVPSGLLLWGPPGTGKTLMAEAVAGETGKPYVFVDPGAFNAMFMGVGILKVKGLFRKLRKLALRYGGVIVFFDEADALGSRGQLGQGGGQFPRATPGVFANRSCHGISYLSEGTQWQLAHEAMTHSLAEHPAPRTRSGFFMGGMGGGGGMGTLQALLTELSGLKKPRGFINRYVRRLLGMRPKPPPKYRILVMMATNLPQALDEALLRPGRIDRMYRVGYPAKPGRIRTYEGYLAKVKNEITPDEIDQLATMTPYATGASIKDMVNEALIMAIRDGRDTITWKDITRSKQLKEMGPPEDVEYIERERHAIAIHEASHAIVAYKTRKHYEIDIATIEKGGTYLGMVSSVKPEDQFTNWKSELEADIMVSLASLAGERMFFEGDNSSGVSGDLEHATSTASNMEARWGMGQNVATILTPDWHSQQMGKQGEDLAVNKGRISERVEGNLVILMEQARTILIESRREVLSLAHALESNKTLSGDDVKAVIERRPGTLLDGRPYASDSFYQEIEAYHRAAVVAHMNHTSIRLPMPQPPAYEDTAWAGPRGLFQQPGVGAVPPPAPNGGHGGVPADTPGGTP